MIRLLEFDFFTPFWRTFGYLCGLGSLVVITAIYVPQTSVNALPMVEQNPVSPEVATIASHIALSEHFESERVGMGFISSQFKRFQRLKNIASPNELEQLLNHESPVVRLYAFQALLHHVDYNPLELLKGIATDTSNVMTQYGCILSSSQVNDQAAELVRTIHQEDFGRSLPSGFYSDVDSILIHYGTFKDARDYAFIRQGHMAKHYAVIREFAYKDENPFAIAGLIKANKQEDKALIDRVSKTDKTLPYLIRRYLNDDTLESMW